MVDTRSVLEQLPDVVLAFYYLGGDAEPWAREAFLRKYQLGDERAPLLRLDLGAPERPFSWG